MPARRRDTIIGSNADMPRDMKTLYYTASTLDGFLADPQNSLDWLFQFDFPGDYAEFIRGIGAIAMGSATYQWILDHQILPGADRPGPWAYSQPSWVFTSRSLQGVPGAEIRFVRGDVRPVHEQMVAAAGGKNIWIVGGGDLVGQFFDQGLLDEIIVWMAPVTLGAGAPLLPRKITTPPMKLLSAQAKGTGFARLHYEVPSRRSTA
jgi:dihydrofolate reductase